MISRYLELIRLLLCQIADSNRKHTDFASPILCPKKHLWDISERRESFTPVIDKMYMSEPMTREPLNCTPARYNERVFLFSIRLLPQIVTSSEDCFLSLLPYTTQEETLCNLLMLPLEDLGCHTSVSLYPLLFEHSDLFSPHKLVSVTAEKFLLKFSSRSVGIPWFVMALQE